MVENDTDSRDIEAHSTGTALFDTLMQTTAYMFESAAAANRAALDTAGSHPDGVEDPPEPATRIEAGEALPEWRVELSEDHPERLGIGDRVEFTKTITDGDVRSFAAASGDTNPLHLDDAYAETTRFQDSIAHGVLVGGLVSAALARLPGPVVYLSQDFEFRAPVYLGDRPTATIEIVEALGDDRYRLTTRVENDGETAIDGEAVVLIDDPPA